jgi:2-phosphoglycerate kinase
VTEPLSRVRELDLPLVILIGGATGTGKSTVATEIAYRLGITRVTSTDFVRETMRAFFSREFMPSIHCSSFEAAEAAPGADDPLVAGFLEQAGQVLVGVRASIERALAEGRSMVLEGVHLVPGLLPPLEEHVLVTACVLKIEDETAHAQHFFTRESRTQRPMARYLDHFAEIRRLQRLIVERAEHERVPVIENENADEATRAIAELVLAAAERARERI